MELFKISEGPWKKLFEGKFQENDVEIYINPESIILVLIYEKEKDKVTGAIAELFKIFYSIGEAESFVETLPREVIVLTKHSPKETLKFLLLGSTPSYVKWGEKEFVGEVDRLLTRLKTSSNMIKDVSKAYELTLQELAESTDTVREAFFTQPLLVPLVSTYAHPAEEGMAAPPISKGEIILGLTKEKRQVVEPLSLFAKTIVSGGDEKNRLHLLHLLVESALLSNVAVVLFDWEQQFSGLGEASKDLENLQKYKVDAEPIGFPVNHFRLFDQIVVDLNVINPKGLTELFGTGENVVNNLIISTLQKNKVAGITDLIEKIKAIKPSDAPTAFEINKAVRILALMNLRYPRLFIGENNIGEISKNWLKAIGRAGIINLKDMDNRAGLLITHNIIKGMLLHYKSKGKSSSLKTMIVLPDAKKVILGESTSILSKEIVTCLDALATYGVGYVIGAEKLIDIAGELTKKAEAKINIVAGNDVGINLKDRKSYRVFVRPGLSRCTE